ncbi:hypothetical protein [Streptomyces sp. NPDC056405]|uniref:hypothetical protein n=1 Tax=Streptomyces sp. NPDC056405 TaxID=3345811 RepID=UPI0035D6F684
MEDVQIGAADAGVGDVDGDLVGGDRCQGALPVFMVRSPVQKAAGEAVVCVMTVVAF